MRTSSRKTSLNSAVPVGCTSGRTSIPGLVMSTMKKVIPLCLGTDGSVRASRMPKSAMWAPEFHTFWPVTTYCVAIELGLGGQCGQVAPGARFTEELGPPLVAPQQGLQVALLLLVGAVAPDGGSHQLDRGEEEPLSDVEGGLLLVEDHLLHDGSAPTSVLGGPGDAGPAGVVQRVLPLGGAPLVLLAGPGLGREVLLGPVPGRLLRRGVGLEPGSGLGSELRRFRGVFEVHGPAL